MSINAITAQINEVNIQVEIREQRLGKLENDKATLQNQFDTSLKILKEKRNELLTKLRIFDPYASSLNSSKSSNAVNSDNDDNRQDQQIRHILDSIDFKIGRAIDEKESESVQMQIMQKQIQEAKDCFTNAYKHYKAIKKEADKSSQNISANAS